MVRRRLAGTVVLCLGLGILDVRSQVPEIHSYSVNRTEVPRFDKFEIVIEEYSAEDSNPFDPQDIRIDGIFHSPEGDSLAVMGFWDGSHFLVRFSPDRIGAWSFFLRIGEEDRQLQSATAGDGFTCIASDLHGFVRVSPIDPRYLCTSDTTSFVGVGQCLPWRLDRYPEFWNLMKAYGCNIFVYWMAAWDNTLLLPETYEAYNIGHARAIDQIIDRCEENGIFMVLTIWDHGWLRDDTHNWQGNWWDVNPFRLLVGNVRQFFTDAACWDWQTKFYRYIIARWGYSRAVAVWQTVCEIDGTCSYENTDFWHGKINDFFKANDPFGHPTTASKSGDAYWARGNEVMDLPQMHAYSSTNSVVRAARDIAGWTRQMWNQVEKPNFIGEFGHPANDALQPYHLHNAVWTALASGSAIMPLDWNDGGTWQYMTEDMYRSLGILAGFISQFDLPWMNLEPLSLTMPWGFSGWGMIGDREGFGWIFKENLSLSSEGLTCPIILPDDSEYGIRFFDTWNGTYIDTATIHPADGKAFLTLPTFDRDMAFHVYQIRTETLQEDFDRPSLVGWETIRPEWSIENGTLKGNARNQDSALILTGGRRWRHYTLTVDFKLASGSEAGFLIRETALDRFQANVRAGSVSLSRVQSGISVELGSAQVSVFENTWHSIRLEVMDDSVCLALDGLPVLEATDAAFDSGGYGFSILQGTTWFDRVRILRDDEGPAAPALARILPVTNQDTMRIEGTKTTDALEINVRLNGEGVLSTITGDETWEADLIGLLEGVNRIEVAALDLEGNSSETLVASCSRYFGQLLAFDDFSDGGLGGWESFGGDWQVVEGCLEERSFSDKSFLVFGDPDWTSVAVSVRFWMPETKILYIPFHWQDSLNHSRVRIKNNPSPQLDLIKIERVQNGIASTLIQWETDLKGSQWPRWVACRIKIAEDSVAVFFDHVLSCQAVDTLFGSGMVGVGSHRTQNRFDDFMVYSIETSDVDPKTAPPSRWSLEPLFPNPFNNRMVVVWAMAERSPVSLVVVDILGRPVRHLVSASLSAGIHRVAWDGMGDTGQPAPTGIYIVTLSTPEKHYHRKALLVR